MGSPITFSGFNQIDFTVVLNAIMQQESKPLQALQAKQQALQATDSSLGQLATRLDTLRSAASALSSASSAITYKATTSQSNIAVTAGAAAVEGRYDVTVGTLARSQVTASSSFAADIDTEIVASGGILTIGGVAVSVNGPVTLEQLVDKINDTDSIPVTASIVETATNQFRLVLTSTETGAAGAFTIANSLTGATVAFTDTDNDNLSGDDAADNAQQATNASVVINGLSVTSSSNTLTTGIPGVTLTLLQESDTPAVVTVERDDASITDRVDTFVAAYNDLVKFSDAQTAASVKGTAGALGRDALLRGLRSTLRLALSSEYGTGTYKKLAEVGLGFTRTGQLTFDHAAFESALHDDPAAVQTLFADSSTGAFKALTTSITDYTRSGGLVPGARTRLTDEMARLNRRMDDVQARLAVRRAALQREFIAADQAMTRLNSQTGSLTSLAQSLKTTDL